MAFVIAKWGNSAAIRLPAFVLAETGVKAGDMVDIIVNSDKSITMRPIRKNRRNLDALLEAKDIEATISGIKFKSKISYFSIIPQIRFGQEFFGSAGVSLGFLSATTDSDGNDASAETNGTRFGLVEYFD